MREEIEIETVGSFPSILVLIFILLIILGMYFYFKNRKRGISQELDDPYMQKLTLLSTREKQVLNEILKNKSQKEIAETLFIEVSTVKSHVNKIYKLFGVNNRKELQVFLQQHDISS